MTVLNVDRLNRAPFDWCFDCAKMHCSNNAVRMFAYIFISLARYLKNTYWFGCDANGFSFNITLDVFLKNDAIKPYILKKKFWKHWLHELIRNHVLINANAELVAKAIKKPAKINIVNNKLEVLYLY